MNDEPLIVAENVGKKFCKSLKRSLYYGAHDIFSAINPLTAKNRRASSIDGEIPLRKDEFWALQDINFELKRGQCLGLIGHNGAGKSTLLKILNGLIKPDTGRIVMRGRVCALIELSAGFNAILSGRENIYNQGALLGLTTKEIDRKLEKVIDFAEIREFIDMPVQNYSSGMKVRLGFAVAAQLEPDILLLDEVLAVGDAAFRFKCLNAMSEMLNKSAVIFVSHSLSQINRVCNCVALLDKGKVAYQGSDIAASFKQYFSKIVTPEKKVTGNGQLELKSAKVFANGHEEHAGSEVTTACKSKLTFVLEFLAQVEIPSCTLSLTIWNQELYPVGSITDPHAAKFQLALKQGKINRCVIETPEILLSADVYYVSLHIENGATYYLRVDNLFSLIITGKKHGKTSYLAPSYMALT